MIDNLDEIRRWHALYRDPTCRHWQHVDVLLAELENRLASFTKDDLDGLVADLESARSDIDDAIHSLRPMKRRKRAA